MIKFWNGNKSKSRQLYELDIIKMLFNNNKIDCDNTNYPSAEDEGNIFNAGTDVLVTVAGNQKFMPNTFLELAEPLCKGLLGCRILIIRDQDRAKFHDIDEETLKGLIAGIPNTWADADLFRANHYQVLEKGELEDVFRYLKQGLCDYVSLGANEVEHVFDQHAQHLGGLTIDKKVALYYPMPLVFYIHPQRTDLLEALTDRIKITQNNGQFDAIFDKHYGKVIENMNLSKRRFFQLSNPSLPAHFLPHITPILDTFR